MAREWRQGAYLITTDRVRLDLETIHGFLTAMLTKIDPETRSQRERTSRLHLLA
jgi:hypothetical protein